MMIDIDPNYIAQCGALGHPEDVYAYIAQKIAEFEQDLSGQAELFDGMVEQK